jgi:hypothetical protein
MSLTLSGDSPKISADGTGVITSGTAVTASGTSVDFTGIPSWVKRITVMFSGVSTNGASPVIIQIGSASVTTSGYAGANFVTNAGTSNGNYSTGFMIDFAGGNTTAAAVRHGMSTIVNFSSNTWVESHLNGYSNNSSSYYGAGSLALGGVLDRIRITTVNGTDTFDAGSINILYE